MALLVQKYGGTSVADADRIRAVADHVARTHRQGNDVIVVVSAMGKETDELIALANQVSSVQPGREMDMLDHLIYGTHPQVSAPAAGDHAVTIAGRTCLAGDVFGEYSLDAPLEVGNEVRFADAAGYTMVKTTWFNGLRMPSIVVRRVEGTVEVVREFGYDDFKRSLS